MRRQPNRTMSLKHFFKRNGKRIAVLTCGIYLVHIVAPVYYAKLQAELYMHIGGRVTDAQTGEPVPDLNVVAINEADITNEPVSGKTFSDGRYSICCVPPGAYILFIDQQSSYIREQPHKEVTVIRGKNVINANFTVQKGSSVSGKVYASDGITPVEKAMLLAELQSDAEQDLTHFATSSDGKYTLQGLKPGKTYRIYSATEELSAVYTDIQSPPAGEKLENLNFSLGNPKTKLSGAIESHGIKIKDARVRVIGNDAMGYAKTDENGNYSISGLIPGAYLLTVQASGYENFAQTDIEIQNEQTRVNNVLLEPSLTPSAKGPPAVEIKTATSIQYFPLNLAHAYIGNVAYAQGTKPIPFPKGGNIFLQVVAVVVYFALQAILLKAGFPVEDIVENVKLRVEEKARCQEEKSKEPFQQPEPYFTSRNPRIIVYKCEKDIGNPITIKKVDGKEIILCNYNCEVINVLNATADDLSLIGSKTNISFPLEENEEECKDERPYIKFPD